MNYMLEENAPTKPGEIDSRSVLLSILKPIAVEYELEVEPATAWEDGDTERVQIAFLKVSEPCGPWCIGTVVRRDSGELRVWPRNDVTGPIQGSATVPPEELSLAVLNMIDQYTAA